MRITEPNEDFHHQHQDVRVKNGARFGDLPEFVNFAYTADVVRVNAAALASLAIGPTAPQEVLMEYLVVDNKTTTPHFAGPRMRSEAPPAIARGVARDHRTVPTKV